VLDAGKVPQYVPNIVLDVRRTVLLCQPPWCHGAQEPATTAGGGRQAADSGSVHLVENAGELMLVHGRLLRRFSELEV
jgi:hypothetical protein